MDYDMALARRRELLEIIGQAADEIAAIDRSLHILQSMALESDLCQTEACLAPPCPDYLDMVHQL